MLHKYPLIFGSELRARYRRHLARCRDIDSHTEAAALRHGRRH
jgi:hypothetical protein